MDLSSRTSRSFLETLRQHVGMALLGVNVLMWIALVAVGLAAHGTLPVAYIVCAVLVAGQIAILLSIGEVRAMARQTFAQCIRMKIAAAFIVVLVLVLVIIATCLKGDGTLAGRMRAFLSYSVSAVSVILSMVTVFLAASLISGDVQGKQILIVATKPLARWQYVTGRWLGLVMVDVALLAPASLAIFSVTQYMGALNHLNNEAIAPADRLAVETEILSARQAVPPEPLNVEDAVQKRLVGLSHDPSGMRRKLDEYKNRLKCDDDAALAAIGDEIRKECLLAAQSTAPYPGDGSDINDVLSNAGPQNCLRWQFKDIRTSGTATEGQGTVIDKKPGAPGSAFVQIRSNPQTVRKLMYRGPISLGLMSESNGKKLRDGRVEAITLNDNESSFWAVMPDVQGLDKNSQVRMLIEPTIQVSFKAAATAGQDSIKGLWVASNPTTHDLYPQWRDDAAMAVATMTVPARIVDDKGRMDLQYINRDRRSITIRQDDVKVLYGVGGFGWNMVRAMGMVLLQLMFLAGLGTLASSFLSFPVACLLTFTFLPFSLLQGYLDDAIRQLAVDSTTVMVLCRLVFEFMRILLPNLGQVSPSEMLDGGLMIGWSVLGETTFIQVAVRGLLVLVLACLIFHKRELARVQV